MLGQRAIARELGCTRTQAGKQLAKVAFCYPAVGSPPRWDARVLDLLNALHGRPHRALEPVTADWLSRYLQGDAMPAQPRKAARGRRDPSLLAPGGVELPMPEDLLAEHEDETQDEVPTEGLLIDGDLLTASVTLAIDLLDTGRTSFVGYKATTRVLEGEHHGDTFGRVATLVNESVIAGVEDMEARLEQYYADREDRLRQATSGR